MAQHMGDLDAIDRKDKKYPGKNMNNAGDVTEFAPDDRWLQRSIDVPNAEFKDEYEPSNETEMANERNTINLTPPPRKVENPSYDYNDYNDENNEIVPLPMLPPPPEMLKMTAGSGFLPIDVPKLGSRIPYQPPELVFDEFYKKTEDQFTSPIQKMFKSKGISSKGRKQMKKGSKSKKETSSRRNDDENLFSGRSLPFEEEINGIYGLEENTNGIRFDETSRFRNFDEDMDELYYNYGNFQGFDEEISDFFPAFDIQKTIANRYDEGSKIDTTTSKVSKEFSSDPNYFHQSSEFESSFDHGMKLKKSPKNLGNQQKRLSSPSQQNKLSFSNLINHPLNEVEMPTYTTYDPMEFKFRKERELNLQPSTYSDNIYVGPSKFQSRSLNIDPSASEDFPIELSMQSRSIPEESHWETMEEQSKGTNRRSLNYGRSLGDGPVPAVLPPPPYLDPHLEPRGKPAVESHQFVHVKDWDKFKAGHGRGNEYHNLHDVQARDGVQHKEAVNQYLFQSVNFT